MQQNLAQTNIETTSRAVACEVGGETVILDIASGQYFALDDIGSAIWRHLQTPRSAASLCDLLLAEYDVSRERCEKEVMTLMEQLAEHGLVRFSS